VQRVGIELEELPGDLDPFETAVRLRGHERLVLLEGPGGAPDRAAFVFVDPLATCDDVASLAQWRARLADFRFEVRGERAAPPWGGFAGVLAYDLGVAGEAQELPRDPWGWPLVLGGVYGDGVLFDRVQRRAWLATADGGTGRSRAERRARLVAELAAPLPTLPTVRADPARRRTDGASYTQRVERVRADIRAGEYYQANLSHRFECDLAGEPLALYAALRRANPAPYMGFVASPHGCLLSSSPELLLDCDGVHALSRPIKGTARRDADPVLDAERARALLASAKDRAELAMIVDLVRNDLAHVAAVGGVRVEALFELESYAHVHHLVATVQARLAPGRAACDALAALFPGGSVTGAPKLRAMRALAELEGEGRGPFYGSLGHLASDGRGAFNILIRTLRTRPLGDGRHAVDFRVGGGVTWRSDPAAEERESLDKARGLLAALAPRGGVAP